MLRFAQITVGATVLCLGSSSFAADIRWSGEDSCRSELEVAEQIESMTGRPVSSVEIADFELRVQAASREEWTLELITVRRTDGARSTRTIHGATCTEVTEAAAVAIALAIGPDHAESSNEPRSEPNSEPPPTPAKPEAATPSGTVSVSARPLPAASSLAWFAGLGAALDSSATPSPAFGASARVGVDWLPAKSRTGLRFEAEGTYYAPTQTSSVAGQGGTFQLAYGAPLVCGARALGKTTLLLCAGAEFGLLSGEGVGDAVTNAHPSNTFWSAARAEFGLGYPREGALRVVGRGGIALPLIRRDFVLDGPDVVFRTAPISARAGLGVELSF